MVSAKAIELIAHSIEKSGSSYDKIAAATTISKTTLSRLVKQHTASRYTLDVLASYFGLGEQYQALVGEQDHSCAFAAELTEELRSLRSYYEQKADAVRQHYEQQISALRDQAARQDEERNRERQALQDGYERSISYLREEISRLRDERDQARTVARDIVGKKHVVFWCLAGIAALLGVALVISLMSGPTI